MKGIAGLNGFVGFPDKNIYISNPKVLNRAGITYLNKDSRGVVWAAQYNGELWISVNDGVDFTNSNNNIFAPPLMGASGHYAIGVDSQDRLYTVNITNGYLFRGVINKTNNDVTWTGFDHSAKLDIHNPVDVFFDIHDNLYVVCLDGYVFKSLDFGVTIDDGLQVTSSLSKGVTNSVGELFVISKTQLWTSKDAGLNWSVVYNFSSEFISSICIDDNDTLFVLEFIDNDDYANIYAKLYSSYDAGKTFDVGTKITDVVNNRFFGIVAIDINKVVITSSVISGNAYSFNAIYSNILDLKIVDKTLDNAELICSMNKGNDSFKPDVALSPTRYAETQKNLSDLRKDITIELEKDGFKNVIVAKDETGEIIIDCKHD